MVCKFCSNSALFRSLLAMLLLIQARFCESVCLISSSSGLVNINTLKLVHQRNFLQYRPDSSLADNLLLENVVTFHNLRNCNVPDYDQFISRLEQLITRVEAVLPFLPPEPDWSANAFRWRVSPKGVGYLQAVKHPHYVELDALKNIETQKDSIVRNTRQFVQGKSANNVLLTGARGTGKSTLVKAVWTAFAKDGLKIIEV